jgi:SpoVK/Ycf46/Vps4 family AAA+-type ATPase
MQLIAMNTPGYVGADLNALIDEALISSLDRRLMNKLNMSNSEKQNQFVTNLIDWIKQKLDSLKNNLEQDKEKNDETIIEVNQTDFEVNLNILK